MLLTSSTILLVVLKLTNAVNICQTPNGQSGDCRPISQCHSLYVHYNNLSTPFRITNQIHRSHCGFVEDQPKVCCHKQYKVPINITDVVTSNLLPNSTVCGISPQNKIFGGQKTDLDEFPWMALLDYDDDGTRYFDCGGALINKRYVLTAAHCITTNLVGVRLGEYNIATDPDCIDEDCAPTPIDVDVEEKIIFKSYEFHGDNPYHDIALLRLKQEIDYSDFIKPICLPTTLDEIFNTHIEDKMTVAGWGMTELKTASSIKLKVQVPVRNCRRSYNRNVAFDTGFVCAGGEKGKDSCKGDSGGPLMYLKLDKNEDLHWYVVGLLSTGPFPCGQRSRPGIYTKVSKYIYWIVDNIKP